MNLKEGAGTVSKIEEAVLQARDEKNKNRLKALVLAAIAGGAAMFSGKAMEHLQGVNEPDPTISLSDRLTEIKALTASDGKERGAVFVGKDANGVLHEIQYVTGDEDHVGFPLRNYKELSEAQKIVYMHSHPKNDNGGLINVPSITDLVLSTRNDFRYTGDTESIVTDGMGTWTIKIDEENPNQQLIHKLQEKARTFPSQLFDEKGLSQKDALTIGRIEWSSDAETLKDVAMHDTARLDILQEIDEQLNTPEGLYCIVGLDELRNLSWKLEAKEITAEAQQTALTEYQNLAKNLGYTITYTVDQSAQQ